MIKSIFKLLLLITFLFLSSGDLLAQVNWTKYPGNPIITGGPSGSWNYQLFTPRVLYNADSSRYEMWFCASNKASGSQLFRPWQIGFAYSTDGIDWTVHPTPVLTPTPGQWDAVTVEEPWVIRENGQYKMWYSGGSSVSQPTPVSIGYATSPDGITWTKHSGPVMSAGSSSWEAGGVISGFVIPYAGGYRMWYSGWDVAGNKEHIGYATSVDGINWVRYQNNPVLLAGANGQWDDRWVAFPSILYIDNIYYMWYIGVGDEFVNMRVGLATSFDGLNWIKHPENPVMKPSTGQWDGVELQSASVMLIGDTLWAWYDGGNLIRWQIGLAKSFYTPLPLPPGTYTIGTGGNFATIQDAFDKLSTDGVAGNVTLELIDELYTAPTGQYGYLLNGPIPGAGPNSRVTIKPAENKNVVIEGNNEGVFYLKNTSRVTLDGVSLTGATSLTIHAIQNTAYVYNDALDFIDNSDHNVIQNITFIVDDDMRASGNGFWYSNTGSFAPDSNLIQNNFIKKAGVALYIIAPTSTTKGKGNIIRGNRIGSETDSLINYGIQVTHGENTIIENNIIQNLKLIEIGTDKLTVGIGSVICSGTIIRNNVIHNLRGTSGFSSSGIILYGLSGNLGNNNYVYNNMIYNINSVSTRPNNIIAGIQIQYQNNPKIYYNSVYLSGSGANQLGSAALYIYSNVTNADIKNNIFFNTRDESPYCASAIYDYSTSNLTSDYNDLYYDHTNNNNCLVRISNTDYHTLAEWQATGKDLHSINKLVNFVSATDLHLTGLSIGDVDLIGTPIANITTDIDGNTRSALYPYKGADEASVVLPVELVSFTARAENQQVILKWITATELNNNGFEVQRGINKTEFATIGFVRGEGTTTNQKEYSYIDRELADGKYYYRLKQIDYNGNYEYSKAIEIDVRILDEYTLEQNYPNPFNPVTIIGYVLKENANAKLVLLNAIGEEIIVLVNEEQDKGYHKVEFNAKELSSGVYFYQLRAVDPSAGSGQVYVQTKKMILLK